MMDQHYSRPNGFLRVLLCVFLMVFVCVFVLVNWNSIKAYIPASAPIQVFATATTGTVAQPTPFPTTRSYATPIPAVNPGGTFNDQAAADAAYATAVAAGEQRAAPVENVGQGAPVDLMSKPAEARQPAGDNVPTAEPLPQVNDAFGSKEKPVNIQETKQCKHGQVWVEGKGCKNP